MKLQYSFGYQRYLLLTCNENETFSKVFSEKPQGSSGIFLLADLTGDVIMRTAGVVISSRITGLRQYVEAL